MLTQEAIVTVAQSRAHMLHPHDLLLLANLIRSNDSFRQAQTFTPVCLPRFNPAAFLHAYVQYLDVEAEVCVVLLSAQAESFFALAEAAQELEKQLKQKGILQSIASQVQRQPAGGLLDLEALPAQCGGGAASSRPLLHFLYKSPTRAQVIAPKLAATFDSLQLQQASLLHPFVLMTIPFAIQTSSLLSCEACSPECKRCSTLLKYSILHTRV